MRARRMIAVVGAIALLGVGATPMEEGSSGPAAEGRFLAPFEEPTVGGVETDATCVEREDGSLDCKPAAGSMAVLPQGDQELVYFNALEGTENVRSSIVAEFGNVAINAQARHLDLGDGEAVFTPTDAVDSGVNRDGYGGETILPNGVGNTAGETAWNDGSLFCADLTALADGTVMAVGGTTYYSEPGVDGVGGIVELEGSNNTRIYDPETNEWSETAGMEFGRWYPTLNTLADGSTFVASGVTKLLKPVYPERVEDSLRNVTQTEIRDPETGEWDYTGERGDRSLPLYPRTHMLPNGHVFYNAGGQVFNPFGQAYDQALWSISASFDPQTRTWQDLGVPGLDELQGIEDAEDVERLLPDDLAATVEEMLDGGADGLEALLAGLEEQDLGDAVQETLGIAGAQGLEGLGSVLGAGFRGSTFSIMMPLSPDDDGEYRDAEFLTAGGAVLPSPGSYLPIPFSRMTTVSTGQNEGMSQQTRFTGSLNTARWYSTGVPLPTGEVIAVSGATADEVVGPGTGFPVTTVEMFDPETEEWTELADQQRERTYHNTATLLPDARVLVGGHDAISTLYSSNVTLPAGQSPDGRDPSFEIFEPPYLHYDVEQPEITAAPEELEHGGTLTFSTDVPADEIESVTLARNTTITHLIDGDQRMVELPVLERDGDEVTVQAPPDGDVAPPGPYLLFANRGSDQGEVPSKAAQLTVPLDGEYAEGEDRSGAEAPEADPGLTDTVPPPGDLLGGGPDVDDGEEADEGDDGEGESEGGLPGDGDVPGEDDPPGPPDAGDLPGPPEGTPPGDGEAGPPQGSPASGGGSTDPRAEGQPEGEAVRTDLLASPGPEDRGTPIAVALVLLAAAGMATARVWRPAGR